MVLGRFKDWVGLICKVGDRHWLPLFTLGLVMSGLCTRPELATLTTVTQLSLRLLADFKW